MQPLHFFSLMRAATSLVLIARDSSVILAAILWDVWCSFIVRFSLSISSLAFPYRSVFFCQHLHKISFFELFCLYLIVKFINLMLKSLEFLFLFFLELLYFFLHLWIILKQRLHWWPCVFSIDFNFWQIYFFLQAWKFDVIIHIKKIRNELNRNYFSVLVFEFSLISFLFWDSLLNIIENRIHLFSKLPSSSYMLERSFISCWKFSWVSEVIKIICLVS